MRLRREDIRRWALWTGKLLLAAVLIAFLMESIENREIASVLTRANPLFIAAALLLLPLNLYSQYRKWRLLVRSRFPFVTSRELGASLLLGFTFGIVTPARIGEFGGRAAGIRRRGASHGNMADSEPGDGPLSAGDRLALIGLTAVDKLATMLITVTAGCGGLLYFGWRHPFMNPFLFTALLAGAGAAAFLIARSRWNAARTAAVRPMSGAAAASARQGFLRRRIAEAVQLLHSLDARRLRTLLGLSLLFYVTFVLQFFLLLRAFGSVDVFSAIAGIGTIMLVKTVIPPVTIGELGIREGASVYVLGHAGILAATAFNASLLLFAINVFLPSVAGLAVVFRTPSGRRDRSPDAVAHGEEAG